MTIPSTEKILKLLDAFSGIRILLLGDLVLDEYLHGEIRRVSREAPVLIIDHSETHHRPGGAANAALNLRALGAEVVPVGVVGNDSSGKNLLEIFQKIGIDTGQILVAPQWKTPTKTRILAGLPHSRKQQVLRVDRGHRGPPFPGISGQLLAALRRGAAGTAGMLISDYGYGAVEKENLPAILSLARRHQLRVTVDSRHQLGAFQGITAATPNLEEAEEILGEQIDETRDDLSGVGERLVKIIGAEAILLTLGKSGIALFQVEGSTERMAALGSLEAVDVTGAGDTVISAFTLAILAGGSFLDAAHLANCAAGLSVMKAGAATVTAEEIRRTLRSGPGENV